MKDEDRRLRIPWPRIIVATVAAAFAFLAMWTTLLNFNTVLAVPGDLMGSRGHGHGYLDSGSEITPAQLERYLPPPPRDAIPYDVKEPLRNGNTVPVKKRWLWVPPGTAITAQPVDEAGLLDIVVPVGSMWWKEFYLETSAGVQLIERRILRKASEEDPGRWRFYAAHYLPQEAYGAEAYMTELNPFLSTPEAEAFFYEPQDWIPTATKNAPTQVNFVDDAGARFAYVFPGRVMCTRCHNGAAATTWNDGTMTNAAFGLHPSNLTADALHRFIEGGAMDADDFQPLLNAERIREVEHAHGDRAAEAPAATAEERLAAKTRRLVAVLRNNCASCHNSHPWADGRIAAFQLDPNHDYTAEELLAVFSVRSARAPQDPRLLVQPGNPEASELYLRVIGGEERLRMPPREGGLPEPDPVIIDAVRDWIEHLPESVY